MLKSPLRTDFLRQWICKNSIRQDGQVKMQTIFYYTGKDTTAVKGENMKCKKNFYKVFEFPLDHDATSPIIVGIQQVELT